MHSTAKRTKGKSSKTYRARIKRKTRGGTQTESQRNYAEMDVILGNIMFEVEKYFVIDLLAENNWDNYTYRKNRIIDIINSKLPLYKKQRYIRTTAMATDDDLTETEEM